MVTPFLKRYRLALQKYKWAGLLTFLSVLGVSSVFAVQAPPEEQFRSAGVLVQNSPVVSFTTTGVELQQQGQGIITEEFLLADILLKRVAEQLTAQGLEITPEEIRENTRVDIETASQDNGGVLQSVNVSYTAAEPERAEAILSVLFRGMVELSRVTNRARLGTIVEALNERLPDIEAELREAEQALEAYDRLEGPAIQAALDGSLLSAISSSQEQRRQNLITLAGIDAQMQSLQAQLGLSPEAAYASSALSADPILAELRANIYESEAQLRRLAQDLRPAHPTMLELQKNLNAYDQLLRERGAEIIGSSSLPSAEVIRQNSNLDPARAQLANQLVELNAQRNALIQQQQVLQQSEVQLREAYARLPNKQLERDRLAQQVALKRALYDQVQAKRIDAQAAEAETVSSLSVATPPSTAPVADETINPIVILVMGALAGLVLGGGVVYLLNWLDPTMRIFEDLEELFEEEEVPLLALVPQIYPQQGQPVIVTDPNHPGNDVYERLRSALQIAGSDRNASAFPKSVLISSTQAREGKTTTAYNLGIVAARSGRRTLIIEMDLRNPTQAQRLGVQPDEQAQIEPLRYYSGHLTDPIKMVPQVENLYLVPGVGPQRNPAAVLGASELERFLQEARARFDFVVLDASDLTSSNDAILLEPKTDGMVLVTRPGFTQRPKLTALLEQLEEKEIRLLGAVINGADAPLTPRKLATITPPHDDGGAKRRRSKVRRVPVGAPVDF